MPTDTKLDKLIINKLTLEQYASIENPSDSELYFVDGEDDGFPSQSSAVANYALLANGDGTTKWGDVALPSASHTWSADQTYTANIAVETGKYIACDTINSKATGNSLIRMYYDSDSVYKCLVGSVYRPTTILGNSDRPYYAKDGEGFQAHELALVEETPQLGVDVADTSGIPVNVGNTGAVVAFRSFHAYQIGKLVFVKLFFQFTTPPSKEGTLSFNIQSANLPSPNGYCGCAATSIVGNQVPFYGSLEGNKIYFSITGNERGLYDCQFFYSTQLRSNL